jgi:hypothetical protein
MDPHRDFWVRIHGAACSLENEGATFDDRVRNIVTDFRAMPPMARQQLAESFMVLMETFQAIDRRLTETANDQVRLYESS